MVIVKRGVVGIVLPDAGGDTAAGGSRREIAVEPAPADTGGIEQIADVLSRHRHIGRRSAGAIVIKGIHVGDDAAIADRVHLAEARALAKRPAVNDRARWSARRGGSCGPPR